jgi:GNAT superfamily N-acetyltransferase
MKFNYPAPPAQLDALQEILNANPEPDIVDIWANWNPRYIVAEDAGSVAGVAGLNWGNDLCELHKLYVPPSSKRKGIGTALVLKVMEVLRENNVPSLGIEVMEGSRPFWEKFAENYPIEHYYDNKYIFHLS